MQRLEQLLSENAGGIDAGALASLRSTLETVLSEEAGLSHDELTDAALALGTMAAAGIGGPKDEAKAEKYLVLAASKHGGDETAATVYHQLAHLHLSALTVVESQDVERYIRTGSYHDQVGDGKPNGHREVAPELAKAVRREIRLLIKEVRVAKGKGAPVKSFRPAVSHSAHSRVHPPATRAAASPQASKHSDDDARVPGAHGAGDLHTNSRAWAADGERGLCFLERSAALGHADGQVLLGNLLVSGQYLALLPSHRSRVVAGNIVDVSPVLGGAESAENKLLARGIAWYKSAAARGHADAWYNLGILHESGRFVEDGLKVRARNVDECLRCMRAAAALGDASAQMWLATADIDEAVCGGGGGVSEEERVDMLVRCADSGHAAGKCGVGCGLGGRVDVLGGCVSGIQC